MPNNIENIEIRSEEVQEILGATPVWIVRAGISVVFFVVLIILLGAWLFKYPDVISSQVVLTTQNPPAQLRAMAAGKLTHIFVEEKEKVSSKQIIAIIENTANHEDVLYLESMLDSLQEAELFDVAKHLQLGDLQQQYASFLRQINDLRNFEELDFYESKIRSVQKQIDDYKIYYRQTESQSELKKSELELAEKQFERSKLMFQQGVASKSEYEKAEKLYLQEKIAYENTLSTLSQSKIQISQLEQQIMELKLQDIQDNQSKTITISESIENIKEQIKKWKQNYLITTPIEGQVTYTNVWSKYQNVQLGSIVATVIPEKSTEIIGKVQVPTSGAGKVKLGQAVNVKLDNFPHMEYGMLKGKVQSISLVPTSSEQGVFYTAEITIPQGMLSNYGKEFVFSQEMTGVADIITEDIRLLERFFNPIKAIFKQNIER